jgi:N-acetylmuramoyl-L-alanine amidase
MRVMLEKIQRPSPNFEPRPNGVITDTIIIHYTDMNSAEEALKRLCDPKSKVSAHFLIGKDGTIYELVDCRDRAWHAGASSWQGEQDLNSRSIGIELDNLGHTFGPEPFPEKQIKILLDLLIELTARYNIHPYRILGHSDVAPLRKSDPGELFPWAHLARNGFGLAPSLSFNKSSLSMSILDVQKALLKIGYACPQTGIWDEDSQKVCHAFQQHFTPHEITRNPTEQTYRALKGLLETIGE